MKENGFTLAEILITLGIIGVVSAITLPILIKNYQKKVTVERLKSTYSILQEAIKRSEIDNGPLETWTIPTTISYTDSNIQYNGGKQIAQKYILPYLQTIKDDCGFTISNKCLPQKFSYMNNTEFSYTNTSYFGFILKNGVAITVFISQYGFALWIYMNGNNSHKIGKDIFRIIVVTNLNTNNWETNCINKPGVYFSGQGCDKNYLKNGYLNVIYGCNKDKNKRETGWLCGALIMLDGWKISDDYPW